MSGDRKSKRVLWEIMSHLEEAGEEDICSLLNQVMGVQPYFGSGRDLAEYLSAVDALADRGDLCIRDYDMKNGRTIYGEFVRGSAADWRESFHFDGVERIWKWLAQPRRLVEVSDD